MKKLMNIKRETQAAKSIFFLFILRKLIDSVPRKSKDAIVMSIIIKI